MGRRDKLNIVQRRALHWRGPWSEIYKDLSPCHPAVYKNKKKKFLDRTPNLPKQNLWLCSERIAFLTSFQGHSYACLNLSLEFEIGTQDFRFTAGSASNILWLHTVSEFSRSPLLPHPLHRNYLTWLFRENMFLFFNVKAFFWKLVREMTIRFN